MSTLFAIMAIRKSGKFNGYFTKKRNETRARTIIEWNYNSMSFNPRSIVI